MFFAGPLQTLLVIDLVDQNERGSLPGRRQLSGDGRGGDRGGVDVVRAGVLDVHGHADEAIVLADGDQAGTHHVYTLGHEELHRGLLQRHVHDPGADLRVQSLPGQPFVAVTDVLEPKFKYAVLFHGEEGYDVRIIRVPEEHS